MVKFMLPGFYEHFNLNLNFIKMFKEMPQYFNDDIDIYAVYGNFQFCIFDGGRIFNNYKQASLEQIEFIKNSFNELGVPLRLVFTNNQLEEEQFYDIFGNLILSICQNEINEIVIGSQSFENYIRKKYPMYSLVSSTTKCLKTQDLLQSELAKDYKMVCLDYNLNKNMKMLKSLSKEQIDKCEFLINPICGAGCPNRLQHYNLNSLFSLTYGKPYPMEQCYIQNTSFHQDTLNSTVNLSPNEIFKIYAPMGFKYFKIEGRTWSDEELAMTYVYYMVKPKHQFFILSALLSSL